ncbi:MAG: hypothetical protein KA744_00085 [Phenylobacterium sp.]|nr:hypothetical protein [Phenylobacterium sp.]MBP9753426.1 hypothetical protein [Phenylobacterium sp.]
MPVGDLGRATDDAIRLLSGRIAASAQQGLNLLMGFHPDAIRPLLVSPTDRMVTAQLLGRASTGMPSLGVYQLANPERIGLAARFPGRVRFADDAIRELTFELRASDLELADGSLISKFLGHFLGPGAGLAILLALMGATATDFQEDLKWNARIERSIAGTPCAVDGFAEWRIQHMRQYTPEYFVSDDPILNPADPIRVCMHQYLLELNGFPPGPIDGDWGSRSEAASRAFAREKRVENNRAAYFRLLLEPLYGPAHQS